MINQKEAIKIIKDFCKQNDVPLYGTCSIDELKDSFYLTPQELEGLTHAISLAVPLSEAVLNGVVDQPTLLYKWHYRQANIQLDRLAFLLSIRIQEAGYGALPIAASQVIDWRKQIGHVSHRHIAVQAGLGWLGRNNLLVTKIYGAHLRLVTILTNLPLPEGEVQKFQCGECYDCVHACPVNAIGNQPSKHDFQKCFELLDYFCKKKNMNLHICGICVKACKGGKT
ncbi:MAG: epoxyqueuosine reductase [bacterium]|nr:MAG: epoxyqueuosine reductase [bacterium]